MGLTNCVAQTALDGMKHGFESYIVTDATRYIVKAAESSATAKEVQKTLDESIKKAGVKLIQHDEILKL